MTSCPSHFFAKQKLPEIRDHLLSWYDIKHRTLPWRTIAQVEQDSNVRGYAVWVSEIMLQQTQVTTVIDYYEKWMKKWPTMQALSEASLEEVNQAWSGLGYYSRAKRLWEGAQKVVRDHDGELPQTAEKLEKILPGVGKYTAAAIASIAFKQKVGVVDGNVIRVLSRMRKIGADVSNPAAIGSFWDNANAIVDDERPGDFNQALMELGALVCTPKQPECSKCPVKTNCLAFLNDDIEELATCKLCLPKNVEFTGVVSYPRKEKKTKVSDKCTLVCILSHDKSGSFCLLQRPKTGLLANLYEFPSIDLDGDKASILAKDVEEKIKTEFEVKSLTKLTSHGEVAHQFSHISQTYVIWSGQVENMEEIRKPDNFQKIEWLTEEAIDACAISTAMKKVFQAYSKKVPHKKRKAMTEQNQPKIKDFFAKRSK